MLLGNKRDKRKKIVKSTSPTPDLKRATVKRQEGGTLFSVYNSIDPYIPPTFNLEVPELNTEIITSPIKKKQEQVIEKAKELPTKKEEPKKETAVEIPEQVSTISEIWKSPYTDKNKWKEDISAAYRKAGITNENAIKMLVSQDALESGWGRSAQGKFNFGNLTTGSKWNGNYTEGKDHDSEGNPIKQKFRAYNSMDEYAVDKVGFLKRLYDFDENDDINKFTAKLTGANKGKRKYAEAKNYATSLINVYNKYEDGGKMQKSEELLIKKALEFGQKTSEKMSPYNVRLIDFIKSKEGFRPKPERDKTDGKLTVGYGLTDPKLIRKYRNGITEEEASKHLIQHLQMGSDSLATMPYYDNLNLGEKTALNDLIYNVGWNKFKNSKRLQAHLKADNDAGAKKEMNHGEHQARGLMIRRNQNRQMYDSTFNWKYKKGGIVKYQPGGKTYTGTTSTNYYGDIVHHLPVWNKDGETNVGLPEVVVTPRNNLNLGEAVNKGRDAVGNIGKEILSTVTPLGDIESAKGIYNDATSGNYKSAAVGLGLLALPNFIKKPVKALKQVGSKVVRDFTNSRKLGIVSPQFQGKSDITDRFLKYVGGGIKGDPINMNNLSGVQKMQAIKLQEAGVDLSRISLQDLQKSINQRKWDIVNSAPNGRFNVLNPSEASSNVQNVLDFIKDKNGYSRVGRTELRINNNTKNIQIGHTDNESSNKTINKVAERGLNSAIQLSNQDGLNGVLSGEYLLSAPKTYSVWKHFKNKELYGNYGEHSNTNMINEAIRTGKIERTPDIDEEIIIDNIEQMKGDATRRLLLENAPVYRLTKESGLPTKTKSVIFDPSIIDKNGRMNVDWNNPNIYKASIPIIFGLNSTRDE